MIISSKNAPAHCPETLRLVLDGRGDIGAALRHIAANLPMDPPVASGNMDAFIDSAIGGLLNDDTWSWSVMIEFVPPNTGLSAGVAHVFSCVRDLSDDLPESKWFSVEIV